MHAMTKIITPAILALSFIGVAGCDSASQAQTVDKLTAQAVSDQSVSSGDIVLQTADTVRPDAEIWQVIAKQSHLKFKALQEGEAFEGEFKDFTAEIKFHPDNLEDSVVKVTVPILGVDAGSTDRNSTLPGKAWFSAKKFPNAIFTASAFTQTSESQYEAAGALTIKGISRPLSLPFTLDIEGGIAKMRSQLEVKRTDWDIGETPWHTDEWVSTSVNLDIAVTAQVQN